MEISFKNSFEVLNIFCSKGLYVISLKFPNNSFILVSNLLSSLTYDLNIE